MVVVHVEPVLEDSSAMSCNLIVLFLRSNVSTSYASLFPVCFASPKK